MIPRSSTYLHVVHFVLADNLDGDLAGGPFEVPSTVDVAECAVAHLFDELPPLETRIPGEFALRGILLSYQLREAAFVYTALLCLRDVLVGLGMIGGSISCLSDAVVGVTTANGVSIQGLVRCRHATESWLGMWVLVYGLMLMWWRLFLFFSSCLLSYVRKNMSVSYAADKVPVQSPCWVGRPAIKRRGRSRTMTDEVFQALER